LTDRYADDRDAAHRASDHEGAVLGDIKDVRSKRDGSTTDLEIDLQPLREGGTQR
jgi:hypothetical protein